MSFSPLRSLWLCLRHFLLFALAAWLTLGCAGPRRFELVRLEEADPPIWFFAETLHGLEIEIRVYAPDNFYVSLTNVLPGFALDATPTPTSNRGEIVNLRRHDETITFNLHARETLSRKSRLDLTVDYTLAETGPEAFLLARRRLTLELGRARDGTYLVHALRYEPIPDKEE